MTNGEKFKEVFSISQVDEGELYAFAWLPNHDAAEFCIDWWNANYSEIPNNLTDCISRQAVIDLMMQKWGENFSGDDAMQESIDAIRVMPSVTPQEPRWIPVSERLPDTDDEVLCWYEYYHWSQEKVLPEYGFGSYFKETKAWSGEVAIGKDVRVIAWMPLPKPYEPQESEG